ncbi:hypothetical protein COCC4DRAFT_49129 [Bipolaris maydis ATCC 48331]|uniref:Carboxypeptidase n=1 Tax=Cochliobolus heterostrophus (strain C4 / ATCC 48331 / race T) TaxID=665024 RepID=N4XQ10_COCH4|nr:uncharacterized protein COCC4DRAFT_49129 [Bipolaris maydis ATCC 48331]ENI07222.1 hypothetical protein COCC4DRAFT_49129 [Bipolaris maydis ATCC 48331]
MSAPTILTIPVELRELIYGFLFGSYTIRHGFKHPGLPSSKTDDSNRTSLLLTCRQIYTEASRHLPLNCTLHFRGTENLLETLLSIDQSVLTRLRHIRVRAYPFPLYTGETTHYYPTYYAANAFNMLPGLCLDTLVVEDCWHGFGMCDGWRDVTTYFDIESLLNSDAWKQLTYITPCTDFIASGYDHRHKRSAQPENWDALIKERDGVEYGAEVKMYIVPYNQQAATGCEKTEDGRTMQPWAAKPGDRVNEDWRIAGPEQDMKGEVRILAKREHEQRQLSHIILALVAFGFGFSLAQQYPLPVTYDTILKSPVDPSITISFKQPESDICSTTAETQKQYSGYVNLPPFTLTPFQQNYSINTFFWFFEARDNPETAPLTIWLNGGPGQSSMVGLFTEVGPCKVIQGSNDGYTTQPRPWGWDRSSNILFIDQPTQTGFSYDVRVNASVDFSNDDPISLDARKQPSPLPTDVPAWRFKNGTFASGLITNTEDLTAIAARSTWHFLQGFLSAFPQYNPGVHPDSDVVESAAINLFAESYGGMYGPIFADFFEAQNEGRKYGKVPSNALEIRVGSVGIVDGVLDVIATTTSSLEFAYNNTYGIEGINITTYQNAIAAVNGEMGCKDLITQCRVLVAKNDPDNLGTDEDTNKLCASALLTCQLAVLPVMAIGRSVYDVRVEPQIAPAASYVEYLNDARVLQSIGASVNFSSHSITVENAFNFNGDAARGTQLASLARLLARGIKVALIYGDADLLGNWYGGQNGSLELASLVPGYDAAFPAAGYADIVVNPSYVGGAVRQYGNLSFSRIYDAGHQVPYYQPEAAFAVFSRTIQGRDISTGREADLSTFATEGPNTSDHKNAVPPQPDSACWIRDTVSTCTEEERAAIRQGKGTVKDGIWMPSESIVAFEKTSGSSSLQRSLPIRLFRRDTHPEGKEVRRNTQRVLIGGLSAAVALLL